MKRFYSFALAAVAIFSVASCQEELSDASFAGAQYGDFKVTAIISSETRTVLENGVKTYWTPGDRISMFNTEGKSVPFSTDITEKSVYADFTNDSEFNAPSELIAVYPFRVSDTDGSPVQVLEENVISNFRIAGTQTAVAGSFDQAYTGAVGRQRSAGSNEIVFTNIHSLIKFTVGGTIAPTTVTLANNGMRMIAGLYHYNITTGEITQGGGATSITLNGPFEVGETYYIAVIPGVVGNGVSLSFDGEVVKNTGETKTLEQNMIYNLGTVEVAAPAEPVEKLEATLVRALQSQAAISYMTTFGGTADKDRNMTMDGEYIYIAETQGNPVLWKISIADGTAVKMPVGTVDNGGTFALACPRIIKNTDPNINGGKDVLAVCNMGQGTAVYLYLYTNGLEADPVGVSMHYDGLGRRLGDQFSVSGSLQSGYVWFKEQNSGAVMFNQLIITSENLANYAAGGIWPDRVMLPAGYDNARGSFYFYPGADWTNAIYTSTAKSAYVTRNEDVVTEGKTTYETTDFAKKYDGCHGFNFFKYNNKDYIAYTSFSDKTLYIIEGAADASGVKDALDAKRVAFEAKIAAEGNICTSGNSGADCMVYQKDGKTYVAGHVQNVGVVVYELK